jgi:hypothetical protein
MWMTDKVPRRIIQTDRSTDLPLSAKASAANLRLLNPDFEYLFFDDSQVEQFVDAEFPQYRHVFDSFPVRIQRYDFFRYLSVYHFGGFYFDTDVFLASGLESLLEFGCVFPFEQLSIHCFLNDRYGMDWEIGNYGFGAAPGHPFIEAIIKNVVRSQQSPEWREAMLKPIPRMFRSNYLAPITTGPGLVSRTLAEYSGARDQVKVLFPEDVRDRDNWYRFGNYGVHLQFGSWRNHERLLYRVTRRYWESMKRRALFNESAKRGGKRTLEFKSSTTQRQKASHLSRSLRPGVASKD